MTLLRRFAITEWVARFRQLKFGRTEGKPGGPRRLGGDERT
jgi:hypothetical protein